VTKRLEAQVTVPKPFTLSNNDMQAAYQNLQLLAAALNGSINSDNNDRLSKNVSSNNARIKECLHAIMEQFVALQDILGGAVRGYVCLDSFHSRVFQGGLVEALRTEILSAMEKVCC
jgi:hypothetical protein